MSREVEDERCCRASYDEIGRNHATIFQFLAQAATSLASPLAGRIGLPLYIGMEMNLEKSKLSESVSTKTSNIDIRIRIRF
jgi:hypothetical protein